MFSAKVIKDSISEHGVRLTTMEATYPRVIHAEIMTHRMFSRNSASSRAIPIQTMLRRVIEEPFVPASWGANQKGMQAHYVLSDEAARAAEREWLKARDSAVDHVNVLLGLGVHKQLSNRLLEPFMWHTSIVTATEWENFFGLRCNDAAQPEIREIAERMRTALETSQPAYVPAGRWHLPFVDDDEVKVLSKENAKKVSVARCARVSYLTHDGKRDFDADLGLAERLATSGHFSPFEHVARSMNIVDASRIVGAQFGEPAARTFVADPSKVFCGNLRGWISCRKEIHGENVFSSRSEG